MTTLVKASVDQTGETKLTLTTPAIRSLAKAANVCQTVNGLAGKDRELAAFCHGALKSIGGLIAHLQPDGESDNDDEGENSWKNE